MRSLCCLVTTAQFKILSGHFFIPVLLWGWQLLLGERNMTKPDVYIDLHLVLMKDGHLLLGKRLGGKYGAGQYHVPAGHLEQDETMVDGIIRETQEEVGIQLRHNDLDLAYVLHFRGETDRMSIFFSANRWDGEIENLEPDKCAGWEWHATDNLPHDMVPYAKYAIDHFFSGQRMGLFGWPNS